MQDLIRASNDHEIKWTFISTKLVKLRCSHQMTRANLLDLHQPVMRKDQFHESIVIMMTIEQTPSLKVTDGHS